MTETSTEIITIRFLIRGKKMFIEEQQKKLHERKLKWWEWHKANPDVYDLFVKYSFEAIEAGRKRYSQWAIINRIRWNKEVETTGCDEFKISNDHIAFYARLFHAHYPEHKDFFLVKQLKEEKAIDEYNKMEGALDQVASMASLETI
jgi:hypothetical protein|tara:strand:- start:523 stop:963 length:441 start_codon:yes stop_codon:yes gene_type:complete